MTLQQNVSQVWRFGIFEVDAGNLALRRNGVPVRIREQSFRVLVYLLQHSGQLVSREDLQRVLWPADTFVDFDHSLNTAMMKLRDALGDAADAPVYIETIPKRGYRFIAPVTQPVDPPAQASPAAAPALASIEVPSPSQAAPPERPRSRHPIMVALALLLLASLATIAFLLSRRSGWYQSVDNRGREVIRAVPITSAPGDAISPVFSPDGREIAFVWDGADRKGYDLYAQIIGADLPLRLTYHQSGLVGPPSWSPDGSQIAFERCDGKRDGIYAIPALGGEERQLTAAGCYYTVPNPVVWLANGNEILMVDRCTPLGRFGVVDLSLATGEKRCLTQVPNGEDGDVGRAFALSPDGSTIAFGRTTVSLCCDVYKVAVHGGPVKQVASNGQTGCSTFSEFGCQGMMWTPDGRSIVYVNTRDSLPALFRVPADGGTSLRETVYPAIGSFTRDGLRFVYSQPSSSDPPAVWRADFSAAGGSLREKSKVIASQFPEMDAQPSPDGARLVWMSLRTGAAEIFVSDSDGHNQTQLTHLNRYSGSPRWSPDGKWIAFDSYLAAGRVQIFLIDREGRNLHAIVAAPFDCAVPSWSGDGKSIYYSGNRDRGWEVWKHNLETGTDVQVTHQGGFDPSESTDGTTVYYSRFYEAGIWKVPAAGGAETLVIPGRPQLGFWGHYAVTASGIYVLDNDAQPHPAVDFYSFATRRIEPVVTLDERPARLQPSLSATADGKTIYFTQYDRQSVIKMMEFAP